MTTAAIEFKDVCKRFSYFQLEKVSLRLEEGQIMGFVGPNGAGKSTTIRILMGLIAADSGQVEVLGHRMPEQQALAKRDIGFVTDDMQLQQGATLAWHMEFMRSIYPGWDAHYAQELQERFYLHPTQQIKSLSHGERVKALLLLVLARRPRLLVLDEPSSGLDPVARHEVLSEFMEVLKDDGRSILFSSHNTQDVEQISDQITFIDRGRIIDSRDKESFLERWRRLKLDVPTPGDLPRAAGVTDISREGKIATVTINDFRPELLSLYQSAGATIHEIQRMTLEEIFVAIVMHSRRKMS